jgi:hypothetical protein
MSLAAPALATFPGKNGRLVYVQLSDVAFASLRDHVVRTCE